MGVTTISPLIRLRDAQGRAAELGVKAANLAAILGAGFPVPDGFVLPASALERALAATSDGAEAHKCAVGRDWPHVVHVHTGRRWH